MELIEKVRGSLLGLAVGDALGTTVEFRPRGSFAPVETFAKSNDFREGALLAVNLGDDADTTGAVYGQLAGTFYGARGIPEEWLALVAKREMIVSKAVLTYCVRGERFCDGHWESLLGSGKIAAVLRRLKSLRESGGGGV